MDKFQEVDNLKWVFAAFFLAWREVTDSAHS
jgi:hypothetical protein